MSDTRVDLDKPENLRSIAAGIEAGRYSPPYDWPIKAALRLAAERIEQAEETNEQMSRDFAETFKQKTALENALRDLIRAAGVSSTIRDSGEMERARLTLNPPNTASDVQTAKGVSE